MSAMNYLGHGIAGTCSLAVLLVACGTAHGADARVRLGIGIGNAASGGVQVLRVPRGSRGDDLGLREGDIIRAINGNPIRDMDDYYTELNRRRDMYTITWKRGPQGDWFENDAFRDGVGGGGGPPRRVSPGGRGR